MRSVWLQGILGIVACEALVQSWFYAEPLRPIRVFLASRLRFLTINGTNLLECKYCMSFWMAVLIVSGFKMLDEDAFLVIAGTLCIHRMSNFIHLVFSYLRDKQVDLRINRGKNVNLGK